MSPFEKIKEVLSRGAFVNTNLAGLLTDLALAYGLLELRKLHKVKEIGYVPDVGPIYALVDVADAERIAKHFVRMEVRIRKEEQIADSRRRLGDDNSSEPMVLPHQERTFWPKKPE